MKVMSTTPKTVNRTMLIGFIGTLVLILVAVGGGWFFILKMSDTTNKYNTEIYTIKAQTDKLAELSWRYQRVLPKKGVVMEAIPDTKGESVFMADMESWAVKNNINITSSNIGNSQAKASKTGDFSQTLSKDNYYELPVRYEIVGQYSDFVKFIGGVNTLRRFNSVNDVSVTADFSDKNVVGRVKAVFVITIYAKK